MIDHVIRVHDEPAYDMARRLFREDGLFVGPLPGCVVHAAERFGRDREGRAVGISADSGLKYKMYFAEKIGEEGLPRV